MKLAAIIAVALAVGGATGAGQSTRPPEQTASFEVATIKRNTELEARRGAGFQPGGRFLARNMPLRGVIAIAFGDPRPLPNNRVIGGPDWMDTDGYNIEAKAAGDFPETSSTPGFSSQGELMLRALLVERFKLSAKEETRPIPAYALVSARRDGRLDNRVRSSTGSDCVTGTAPAGSTPDNRCGFFLAQPVTGVRHYRGRFLTMDQLAASLSGQLGTDVDRPVINRTGISGAFSFELDFTPGTLTGAVSPTDGVSIFTALSEQLGLKLESVTAPVTVIVVDHAERPTED